MVSSNALQTPVHRGSSSGAYNGTPPQAAGGSGLDCDQARAQQQLREAIKPGAGRQQTYAQPDPKVVGVIGPKENPTDPHAAARTGVKFGMGSADEVIFSRQFGGLSVYNYFSRCPRRLWEAAVKSRKRRVVRLQIKSRNGMALLPACRNGSEKAPKSRFAGFENTYLNVESLTGLREQLTLDYGAYLAKRVLKITIFLKKFQIESVEGSRWRIHYRFEVICR